jgi:hypothetical protein
MLFRTVYGSELEAIYQFIVTSNAAGANPQRQDIYAAFIPEHSDGKLPPTQNVVDALAFLKSSKLVNDGDGFRACVLDPGGPFALTLLRTMRRIERKAEQADHIIDPLYTLLLTELFVKPDCLFVKDVHAEANRLRQVKEVGGLTREKIQAWKRVMEFLGFGRRAFNGFLCTYTPELVLAIVNQWSEERGTLQSFFADHFDDVLPYAQANGELARAVAVPMTYLATQGHIELFPLQDSPTRPYFGTSRYKGIARRHSDD